MEAVTRNIPTPDPGAMDVPSIIEAFAHRMRYSIAKDRNTATDYDIYRGLALAVRDRLMERWLKNRRRTDLEQLLAVFDQGQASRADPHLLDILEVHGVDGIPSAWGR